MVVILLLSNTTGLKEAPIVYKIAIKRSDIP
jgi:hypothetical protein